ncbi:helix-turn-helix domain-containing protein [Kitasatospora viridis]|uniref:Helix-turn-helix protein n=1 Tax=Kitasatospora viridis TaxID=281105 RepID=A0A561UBR5_9ACTN|nr:helix-turn-helix transcriptional regulator [Kitasatospora viridis]TWF96795.1 helix-turn-helix protein [Kitasatospora viridis]
MIDDRRRKFGARLALLRRTAGLSQRQLAARLCMVSGPATVTHNEISRWERGERIPNDWLPLIARALSVPLADLERAAAHARGDITAPQPRQDVETLRQLLATEDLLVPVPTRPGGRLGAQAVAVLAGRVHGLRLADDVLAGQDLIGPAFRELGEAARLHREHTFTEETGRALLVQVGELAQIAGWIASDAGCGDHAEQAYRLGISAARQAGDRPLLGQLEGSLAYHWSNNGRARDGRDLARAALTDAGPAAHPKTRALFLDRIAWTHTRTGEPQPALTALGRAHEALSADATEEAPQWAYWVSEDELRVMDARVATELRRPLRAVPLLTEVLATYDPTHAREIALYRSWLAMALADANEPEQAAEQARNVIAGGVASERIAERSRVLLHRLGAFAEVPEVRALLDGYDHLLRQERQ